MPKLKKPVDTAVTVADAAPDQTVNVIGSQFYGVKWDATSLTAVQTVAEGLVQNAKALKAMAKVFQAQNIHIHTMLNIGGKDKDE